MVPEKFASIPLGLLIRKWCRKEACFNRKIIPKVVFEEYLYNLKSLGIKKVDVIIEYKTDKILVKNILNDKFWTPNKLELKHRYLFFRKINLGKNIECVW